MRRWEGEDERGVDVTADQHVVKGREEEGLWRRRLLWGVLSHGLLMSVSDGSKEVLKTKKKISPCSSTFHGAFEKKERSYR